LKPIISTQYVTLSEDVEIIRIDDKKTLNQTPAFSWNAQIQLVLGRGVQLELYGLQGNLSGQLLINDYSGGIMTGKGIIYIKGGYNAHGQNLRVQRGKVIFNGGMVENPLLDIQATKQVKIMSASQPDILQKAATLVSQGNTTTVGISVTGSLKSRQTALFSDPVVLSQADILSYIVLDRPADQARKLDARLLLKAASAFSTTADPTEKLTHQLESSLGLSEINLEWVNKGTMAMPGSDQYSALTLGKALSSRLYVNYSIGVFEAIQTLKLRYLLTPRLSFQTETNRLGNSIDLLYTIESDR
ncbi:MAG: translocation/assembly module TamB domain-containing protein, partial [Gammaproteobacteria bacterium]